MNEKAPVEPEPTERARLDPIAAIAAIKDPLRRSLFDFVSTSPTPVSRDAAAAKLGIPRSTAAFHLDRLSALGLLTVEYRRLSGKVGPGSGRPSKLYRRAAGEVSVSLPERHYDLAAELLAAAIGEAARDGEPILAALERVAGEAGRKFGARMGSLRTALEATGFAPHADSEGGIILTNCPFHRLAERHPAVVCAANHSFLLGVADGAGEGASEILLEPAEGRCCVRVAARDAQRA